VCAAALTGGEAPTASRSVLIAVNDRGAAAR